MFGRFLILGLLLAEAGAEAASGSAATPPPTQQQQPAQAPAFDADKARAEERAKALKELGFDDEKAYKSHLAEQKKAAEARLTEQEKQALALKEALDERGKLEAKAEKHKARVDELEARIALRDTFDAQNVKPSDRIIVEALLDAERKKTGFDETKFFESLRKDRPYLFSGPAPAALATTSLAATSAPASMIAGAPVRDMSRATPEEWRAYKKSLGIS